MSVLTINQRIIVTKNKEAFGNDLRVGWMPFYDEYTNDWNSPYTVFLYVNNDIQGRNFDYLTHLGLYDDYEPIVNEIRKIIKPVDLGELDEKDNEPTLDDVTVDDNGEWRDKWGRI